uniref:Uncharacterized protein n=1 Tax=Vitis vinifera TaxID=29760 RepID=A5B6M7_VITVI|nr:hypothetical protein VITISV_035794 [Vitis vinifera]
MGASKNRRFYRLIVDFLPSFSVFSAHASTGRFFGSPPIFRRYIGDFADFWPIFPSIDNRCRLSLWCRPIFDISPKYRRYFPIFQSMLSKKLIKVDRRVPMNPKERSGPYKANIAVDLLNSVRRPGRSSRWKERLAQMASQELNELKAHASPVNKLLPSLICRSLSSWESILQGIATGAES